MLMATPNDKPQPAQPSPPADASKQNEKLDGLALAEMLQPGGALAGLKPDFETREPQVDMLAEVVEGFNEDRIVVVEAGTGVGKSLAYLIPAFAWVLQNEERVIISTATINLQRQILNKDIPLVRELFADEGGKDLKIVIAKGRNHYLCADRLADYVAEKGLFAEEQLEKIRQWAEHTDTGDLSDMEFKPDDLLWSQVNSDHDSCPDSRCRQGGGCFLQKARWNMANARIIVTNHHLLFADLAIRNEGFGPDMTVILPAFQRLIIDEAHNVESAATSYFSEEFNRFHINKYANRLLRTSRGRQAGIIAHFRKAYKKASFPGIEEQLQSIREKAQELDSEVLPLLYQKLSFRLSPAPGPTGKHEVTPFENILQSKLLLLQQSLQKCVQFLTTEYKRLDNEQNEDPRLAELRIIIRRLESTAQICSDFQEFHHHPELVYWLEQRQTGGRDSFLHLTASPIEVGPILQDALFNKFPSIILTSATLSVDRSIQFWQQRVGVVEDDRLRFKLLDSPFDYPNRSLLAIPTDAPEPTTDEYLVWLKNFLPRILAISEGHALLLFTSYKMLNDIYGHCKPILQAGGISCFRQGDDDRDRLMVRFRQDISSVLFATHSFWEGIDAPGDALKMLIICRLPFSVPSDPVLCARTDAIKERGGNPFFDLSLPEAIMKLKQGFGRLIRRKSDRGVVLMTDSRLVNKSYGRAFINSLPPARRLQGDADLLCKRIEAFLYPKP